MFNKQKLFHMKEQITFIVDPISLAKYKIYSSLNAQLNVRYDISCYVSHGLVSNSTSPNMYYKNIDKYINQ